MGEHGTVLVTGAARGIGRATAEAFAAAGWTVVAGVRDPASCVPFDHAAVHVVPLDVTDADAARAAVARAEDLAGGALACVVNNAGWALFGAVEDADLDVARAMFETNLFGALHVTQAAVPAMRRAGTGVVVNVSSLSGRIALPLFGLYSASKQALAAVSEALSLELGPLGVRVVLLEAGVVRTEFAKATVISGLAGTDDPRYAPVRDRILGFLRGARERSGLEPGQVADAIVAAVQDPHAPLWLPLADDDMQGMLAEAGGPSPRLHAAVQGMVSGDASPPGAPAA